MVRTLATRRETDMSLTLPGADIHGFYTDLNITLPTWAQHNAAVRCFADSDHHHNADQHPSTSVHLHTGAWNCHGCGARGGAYDAAITRGHTPRTAIELMIQHGLIEPRARLSTARELIHVRRSPYAKARNAPSRALRAGDHDVRRWQAALTHRLNLVAQLCDERGWSIDTLTDVEVGWDRGRITVPVRDADHGLTGVLRYRLNRETGPKMLAIPGTRLGLIPHPIAEPSRRILLVEGPPDMLAARSRGLPAIAVPGDQAWQDEWGPTLAGRQITVMMDADQPGRAAAQRIKDSLGPSAHCEILDIAPDRNDGYDLTDWLLAHSTTLLETAR
jgi:hypothetical protein